VKVAIQRTSGITNDDDVIWYVSNDYSTCAHNDTTTDSDVVNDCCAGAYRRGMADASAPANRTARIDGAIVFESRIVTYCGVRVYVDMASNGDVRSKDCARPNGRPFIELDAWPDNCGRMN
jgi:hypothetical protein